MKKYYINYERGFANEYTVCWADAAEEVNTDRWTRITRRAAIKYCLDERDRRRNGCGGYASAEIVPYTLFDDDDAAAWYVGRHGLTTDDGYIYDYR